MVKVELVRRGIAGGEIQFLSKPFYLGRYETMWAEVIKLGLITEAQVRPVDAGEYFSTRATLGDPTCTHLIH